MNQISAVLCYVLNRGNIFHDLIILYWIVETETLSQPHFNHLAARTKNCTEKYCNSPLYPLRVRAFIQIYHNHFM